MGRRDPNPAVDTAFPQYPVDVTGGLSRLALSTPYQSSSFSPVALPSATSKCGAGIHGGAALQLTPVPLPTLAESPATDTRCLSKPCTDLPCKRPQPSSDTHQRETCTKQQPDRVSRRKPPPAVTQPSALAYARSPAFGVAVSPVAATSRRGPASTPHGGPVSPEISVGHTDSSLRTAALRSVSVSSLSQDTLSNHAQPGEENSRLPVRTHDASRSSESVMQSRTLDGPRIPSSPTAPQSPSSLSSSSSSSSSIARSMTPTAPCAALHSSTSEARAEAMQTRDACTSLTEQGTSLLHDVLQKKPRARDSTSAMLRATSVPELRAVSQMRAVPHSFRHARTPREKFKVAVSLVCHMRSDEASWRACQIMAKGALAEARSAKGSANDEHEAAELSGLKLSPSLSELRELRGEKRAAVSALEDAHWLEVADPYHRYGSALRPYYKVWLGRLENKEDGRGESFWKFLDEGEGRSLDLLNDCCLMQGVKNQEAVASGPAGGANAVDGAHLCKIHQGQTAGVGPNSRCGHSGGTAANATHNCSLTGAVQGANGPRPRHKRVLSRAELDSSRLEYCNAEERMVYLVHVKDGLLKWANSKQPSEKGSQGPSWRRGDCVSTGTVEKWIFAMDLADNLYVNKKVKGRFHHSCFLAGARVRSAGRIVIEDGVLKAISPTSGHYRPTVESVHYVLVVLKLAGIDTSQVRIETAHESP